MKSQYIVPIEVKMRIADFVTTRLDHHRRQHRVEIRYLALGVMLGRAARAMNLLRGEVAGPGQREQQAVAHRSVGIYYPGLLQAFEYIGKHRIHLGGVYRIK